MLSFFHGEATHVVDREKEAIVARPRGHILRSGDASWIDPGQFGLTCYAAGIFGAQVYVGNLNFARLLPVVRNALGVVRGSGQRLFVWLDGAWRQLGVPSAFAMTPGEARWIYRVGACVIEARVWCARDMAASFLQLRVVAGEACAFLITHQIVLGATEFEWGGDLDWHGDAGWVSCRPDEEGLMGGCMPRACFAMAATDPADFPAIGGDELLHPDGEKRGWPYVVFRSGRLMQCGVVMLASLDGAGALPAAVLEARRRFADGAAPAQPEAFNLSFHCAGRPDTSRLGEVNPWFNHNAAIHFSAPHGLEQYSGAAWGVRDVCQGSVEWLIAAGKLPVVRRVLEVVFAQQYPDGSRPQWFMHPPFQFIQQRHSHGDVCFWPVKALCDYVEAGNDLAYLGSRVRYPDPRAFTQAGPSETMLAHADRVVAHCESRFVDGTALINYGDGDCDDTLQPADPVLRTHMISAWTVALAYHTFRLLATVCDRAGERARANRLRALLTRMGRDFRDRLMPGGTVAGFLLTTPERAGPLLHPRDTITGIRHRLLPMTRAVLAELFTLPEARHHLDIVERELRHPDGVRLTNEPAAYHGGRERIFKRGDSAANVGREIGLQYVHAHLRYAETMAKVGDADALWRALEVVNPVGLSSVVANAAPRQSNVYFSSSDASFADRCEAASRWKEVRTGAVSVHGGWRMYSSGPGLYLNKVQCCLLGIRESFGDLVIDPVLPGSLDGLVVSLTVRGRPVRVRYRVGSGNFAPSRLSIDGIRCTDTQRELNPFRMGGLRIPGAVLDVLPAGRENLIEVEL